MYTNLSSGPDVNVENALQLIITDMHANQQVRTWTTIELYDDYCGLGGMLSRKQMLSNLVTYLGDDIVVMHMEGCASVVGFKDIVGKSLKLVKVDSADDHSVDAVIRQVRREARAM